VMEPTSWVPLCEGTEQQATDRANSGETPRRQSGTW
jgi:hypothetical protein